ncbi:acyltransferase family protein [Caldimonas sp. KR1-144]|uniref:acyltransferase family protein n=1 Tax=Caldimonas sp. KR1-144 TaxID=3400911 RepID=UPI003C10F7E4
MGSSSSHRLDWVDYAKGICIVAVVMMYAARDLHQELGQLGRALPPANWLDELVEFARPFRMPDFFLISGLFLARVIDRPWRAYLDKKVVHYLYFFVLWSAIIFAVRSAAQSFDRIDALALEFLRWMVEPYAMLWFIQLLAVFFVFTKLTRRVPTWAMLAFGAGLFISEFRSPIHQLQNFGERFVFFYAGYAFAPWFFKLVAWVQTHRGAAVVGLIAWAAVNGVAVGQGWSHEPVVALALGLAGACAVISISGLLSLVPWMGWLRYLGQQSLVVYVGFYIPLAAMTRWLVSSGWPVFNGWGGLAITAFGILAALCLYWAVRGTWLRWLFKRPAWAHLDRERPAAVVAS